MRRPPSTRALDYPTWEEEKTLKMLHTVAEKSSDSVLMERTSVNFPDFIASLDHTHTHTHE